MFEGVPSYPKPDRFWQIVDKFKVNIFYTAPTVIRALMREGEEWTKKYDLSSLRLLGSVGEPSTRKHGSGITTISAAENSPSSTHGGRQKPAAS